MYKKKEKLFCIPYAGGSSYIYNFLKNQRLPYEIVGLEYPGHGDRNGEPLQEDIKVVACDFLNKIELTVSGNDYSILGYSMGSLVAYEVYQQIIERNIKPPSKLFFCAANPPHIGSHLYKNKMIINISDLKKYLLKLGGTPEAILGNTDILEYILPIFQNDIKLYKKYIPDKVAHRIKSQVNILYSGDEESVNEWKQYIEGDVKLFRFDKGHFFIHKEQEKFVQVLQLD